MSDTVAIVPTGVGGLNVNDTTKVCQLIRVTFLAVLATVSVGLSVYAQVEPGLAKSTEKLSAGEAKTIRQTIASQGPTTASPSIERPYPRVLIVPKDVEEAYAKKPEATARLLLKIVDDGEPLASIHASACIYALLWSPEAGWMATLGDEKFWDDPIDKNRETNRAFAYTVCVQGIAEMEKARAEKNKE